MKGLIRARVPHYMGESWWDLPFAVDADHAAELAAERYICEAAAYERIGGAPIEVDVNVDGEIKKFEVTTEPCVNYSASPA